ncbi:hypothetical protein [Mesorhizobium sp.]|uniref:hypothetical protein n=1 Tax=Mesorhizobium sp. TaxID=1871066 RepID=UPI00257AC384|nr:hypothetical protein [Mesorhizobium sp.]
MKPIGDLPGLRCAFTDGLRISKRLSNILLPVWQKSLDELASGIVKEFRLPFLILQHAAMVHHGTGEFSDVASTINRIESIAEQTVQPLAREVAPLLLPDCGSDP